MISRGDHLVSPRAGYDHHGIYLGNGEVIHYSGFANDFSAGQVEVTTLADFCQNNGYRIKQHKQIAFDVEQRIKRAQGRLGENHYHLISNNCEHFVNWCFYGKHKSEQVTQAAIKAGAIFIAASISLVVKSKIKKGALKKDNQA